MITLLVLLNICHFLADYTWLSTPWMLRAKFEGRPLFPILVHAQVHAILMGTVLHFYLHGNIWKWDKVDDLFFFQWITHFGIDTLKGRMNVWFPSLKSPVNVLHWTVFGGDQLLHQIVIILMAYYAVN